MNNRTIQVNINENSNYSLTNFSFFLSSTSASLIESWLLPICLAIKNDEIMWLLANTPKGSLREIIGMEGSSILFNSLRQACF